MKKIIPYIVIIVFAIASILISCAHAQTSASYRGTSNGVTVASTQLDTARWKQKTVSKEFEIAANIPIIIESASRSLIIKTWDKPYAKMEAIYNYNNDDSTSSFDSVMMMSNVKIKNSPTALEILGGTQGNVLGYTIHSTYDPSGAMITEDFVGKDFKSDSPQTHIVIKTKDFNLDTMIEQKRKLVVVKSKAKEESSKKLKERQGKVQEKIRKNANAMQELSLKLAKLSKEDANKNEDEIAKLNLEIGKLNQEIGQLSIQTSALSQQAMNFNFDNLDNVVVIGRKMGESFSSASSGSSNGVSAYGGSGSSYGGTVSTFNSDDLGGMFHGSVGPINIVSPQNIVVGTPIKRQWTIYIPKGHRISVDSKYGSIKIESDIDSAKIIAKNANIEMLNAKHVTIRNEFGNIYADNLENADIDIRNGKLKTKDIKQLKINSRFSSIDLGTVGSMTMKSANDDYDLTSVDELVADKNFGSLRLSTLGQKLELTGNNADVKVRTLTNQTKSIKIDDKFAKISLPFTELHDYKVTVKGTFNTTYDDFSNKQFITQVDSKKEDSSVKSTLQLKDLTKSNGLTTAKFSYDSNNSNFTASSGNGTMMTDINCSSCTLDFK